MNTERPEYQKRPYWEGMTEDEFYQTQDYNKQAWKEYSDATAPRGQVRRKVWFKYDSWLRSLEREKKWIEKFGSERDLYHLIEIDG
jgi:hypothetical protein